MRGLRWSLAPLLLCCIACGGSDDRPAGSGGAGNGGASTGGAASGGGAPVCALGTSEPCYTGPEGTDGVGLCRAGTRSCAADGWSACVDEVVPRPPNCATAEDEACTGQSAPCSGTTEAVHAYPVAAYEHDLQMGADAAGNVVWFSHYFGTDFPAANLGEVSTRFVMSFDPSGQVRWSKSLGDHELQSCGRCLAVDPSGGVVFSATARFPVDLGNGVAIDAKGPYVAKLDADGVAQWALQLGEMKAQEPDVGVDASGNITLSGTFYEAIDLGSGPLVPSTGVGAFLARLAPDGAPLWQKEVAPGTGSASTVLATDAEGGFAVMLGVGPGADLGAGALECATADWTTVIARYQPGGDLSWSRCLTINDDFPQLSMATEPQGHVALAAGFDGQLKVGNVTLSSNGYDAALVSFDAQGAVAWHKHFSQPDDAYPAGLVIDPVGHVTVVGTVVGTADFGGGTTESIGADPLDYRDIWLAKHDADGSYLWSRRLGGGFRDAAFDVAALPDGRLVLTGEVETGVAPAPDVGAGPISCEPLSACWFFSVHQP